MGKVPLEQMMEPRHEPQAEHAGIHGNPDSGNHQALPH